LSVGDPDSQRIWWQDAGVHQNLIFPVQPDPVSGQHCRHQKVRLERVQAEDRYGDIYMDTEAAHKIYRHWLKLGRLPAPEICGDPSGSRVSIGRHRRHFILSERDK
jgi:hypothetical protein